MSKKILKYSEFQEVCDSKLRKKIKINFEGRDIPNSVPRTENSAMRFVEKRKKKLLAPKKSQGSGLDSGGEPDYKNAKKKKI